MKQVTRILSLALVVMFLTATTSCSRNNSYKIKVVKPKKHIGWFDSKKDRRKKRTKVVTYKVHRGIKY